MSSRRATQLAMPVAGLMIAHQVAAKAVRDAAFLSAWPVSTLPIIVIVSAVIVVATVPVFSRLLERLGPRIVVSAGFVVSATAHVVEWRLSGRSPWVAIGIYLHIACLGGLLLSGFWSVVSGLFDPRAAKESYGRIAAAGTVGGLVGGLAAARIAATLPEAAALLLLAGLHASCALGVLALGGSATAAPAPPTGEAPRPSLFNRRLLRSAPHLQTLGVMVILGAAGAAIFDFLLKVQVSSRIGTGAGLLQFFATFYVVVQLATVLAQLSVSASVRRLGLGTTISALPASVGAMGTIALLYQSFPIFIAARGVEAVLRGSFFRGAYELIFVPMDPLEKHRTKTFLDVTCDRLGDAVGAGVVQVVLFAGAAYLSTQLLAVAIGMAAWSLWLASRLDALYLGVVERRLTTHRDAAPIVVGSETGWTVLDLAAVNPPERQAPIETPVAKTAADRDPTLARLADLRSGDRVRVTRALGRLTQPDALEAAQVVQLLAWDDMVASARQVLERVGASHVGLLTDALVDPETDFAIRRRVPRILGAISDSRVVAGLVHGLDDTRFEVRYQCSRALRRLRSRNLHLSFDNAHLLSVVERELSVPSHVWSGHRLIDHVEPEDEAGETALAANQGQRNLEHVFSLLSIILPPEPLTVALGGIGSTDVALRGVAIEYLESVLPPAVWVKLWTLVGPHASDRTEPREPDDSAGR